MFYYAAYGLEIASELELPELLPCEASAGNQAQVVVRRQAFWIPAEAQGEPSYSESSLTRVLLYNRHLGTFVVREGREIIAAPVPDAPLGVLQVYSTCVLLPILLYQRGLLLLHGSAVALHGVAVAFLGVPGQGKSTMAVALCERGHTLIADDITALTLETDRPRVFAAAPHLRLKPDVLAALGEDAAALPRMQPGEDKRLRRVDERFIRAALPLDRIYLLEEGETLTVEPVSAQTAAIEFIRHSFFSLRREPAVHMRRCAAVARCVSVYRLKRPRDLALLPQVAQFVERHVAGARQSVLEGAVS